MTWNSAEKTPRLAEGEVHAWAADLSVHPDPSRLADLLDDGERLRAERFMFDEDRRCFIVSHAVLRIILGGYAGESPRNLVFKRNRWGKPSLKVPNGGGLRFSMSHSGAMALYGVARGREIGVDIEEIRPEFPGFEIARRFFSAREVESLHALAREARTAAFFCCWARKEAFVKAVGTGLHVPLDAFDVTVEPGAPAEILEARFETAAGSKWSFAQVPPLPGYAAALAVEGAGAGREAFRFPPAWLP